MQANSEHAPLLFDGWYDIGRDAMLAAIGFLALIVILRVSGKRTLSKMNVFDFVFVVAVGSLFAATIVDKDVTLIEGLVAISTLVVIQLVLAEITARSFRWERLINGEPTLVASSSRPARAPNRNRSPAALVLELVCVLRLIEHGSTPSHTRANPDGQKFRLPHLSRRSRASLGGVDGASLLDRAPEDGATIACRKRRVSDRAACARRSSVT